MRINVLMKQGEIAHRQMRDDAYLVSGSCASLLRARARANKRPRGCRAVVRMRCNLSDDEQRVKDARWREEGRINRKRAGDHPSLSLSRSLSLVDNRPSDASISDLGDSVRASVEVF